MGSSPTRPTPTNYKLLIPRNKEMSLYGLLIGVAVVIFISYFQKHNKIIPKNRENIFLFSLIILSFLGARIYFVSGNLNYFLQNPLQILNTRAGGLGILGGIVFTIIYLIIYCQFKKINFIKFTDSFVTIIPLCISIGRIGNILNHEIFPVCIYELILDFFLFLILLKIKNHQTAYFFIGYSFIRFILEFFRSDALPFWMGTWLSLLGILIGIMLLHDFSFSWRRFRKKPSSF